MISMIQAHWRHALFDLNKVVTLLSIGYQLHGIWQPSGKSFKLSLFQGFLTLNYVDCTVHIIMARNHAL